MADIITLAARRSTVRAPEKDNAEQREAEIVFFTGVRYERYPEAPVDDGGLPEKGGSRRAGKR